MKKVVCQSISDGVTRAFGRKLASQLSRGGTILLEGELGAGKTTFVQGLAEGLGIAQALTSPTFTLMNVYPIAHPQLRTVVHIDLYRLTGGASIADLDLGTVQNDPHTLVLVEWPERAPNMWTNILGTIRFTLGDSISQRQLEITGHIAPLFK